MNDFKGLSRDTSVIKTPEQMWQFARNILISNKYLSITNEKGNEYGYEIPGVVIGYIITNEDIVYFSIDNGFSCIGYVNQFHQIYTPVLRTTNPNFKFNLNCPIEGIYIYNYKKELLVVFSDGVNINSSTPKMINLHNPQVPLSGYDFMYPDDYLMFELFNYTELPTCDFSYEQGSLDAEVIHLSFCYVFDDNTDAFYSPIIETVYPNFKGYNSIFRNVVFKLDNLSSKFKKIKLAFIIKKDAGVFAYTTNVLNIVDNKLEYTLSSEEDLKIITPDEIVITPERFTKIRTLTKTANQILVGNVEKAEDVNYQKYANMLTLKIGLVPNTLYDKYKTHPTFMPDEVYAFSIVPIFRDGTKGGAFHIPGRKARGTERNTLSDAEITTLGLGFSEYKGGKYKRFHLENTANNFSAVNQIGDFGYWENENVYPNKDYFNSTSVGGENLIGTPIRYHRIPSVEKISSSIFVNQQYKPKPQVTDIIDDSLGYMPKFFIEVENFEQVFPTEILEQLQGYELVFEKRTRGGTYIETNGFLYKYIIPNGKGSNYKIEEEERTSSGNITSDKRFDDFTICNFVSPETVKDKIDINANIVRCYLPITQGKPIVEDGTPLFALVNANSATPQWHQPFEKIAAVKDAKYLLANNVASNNRFGEEKLELTFKHLTTNDTDEAFIPISSGNDDLNLLFSSLITLNKNIYNLENNNDFISVGIVLLNKPKEFLINGDVFSTNVIRKLFSDKINKETLPGSMLSIHSFINFYLYGFYTPFSNKYLINGVARSKEILPFSGGIWDIVFSSYYKSWKTSNANLMNSFDYATTIKEQAVKGYFNDYVGALPPSLIENYINYFPYRIYKGLAIPNESLQTKNLRYFPTNSYYDMRNDRGDIIALRGYNRGVYIQQRFSLFETTIADKLNATAEETYLGSSELFDRIPEEVLYNDNIGYIGSNSQFSCIIFRDGYVTIDEERGKVFIVNAELSEISQRNIENYFRKTLPLGNKYLKKDLLGKDVKVDNPFSSIGYIVGFDEENDRLLVTKKYYSAKENINATFDGEFYKDTNGNILDYNNQTYFVNESKTFSYAVNNKVWICEHDYFPNAYLYNNKGLFVIQNKIGNNSTLYKTNSDNVNPANYFGKQFKSYIDLIFNGRLDLSKQYQAVYWVSESFDMITGNELQFDTIDEIMIYNNHQCSDVIPVSKTDLKTARNTEGIWQLNEFRDMLLSPDKRILDDNGVLLQSNLASTKQWFNKGLFFGNFIVTRLVWNNETKVLKHIHNVNVKSVLSQR